MDFQCITLDIALMCECNSFYGCTIQIVHDQFNCVNMLWMYTLHMVLHFLLQFLLLLHQNHDFIQWFFMVDFGTLIPYWYLTLIRQRSIFFDIPKVYWYLSYWLEYSCLFQEIESQRPAHSMKNWCIKRTFVVENDIEWCVVQFQSNRGRCNCISSNLRYSSKCMANVTWKRQILKHVKDIVSLRLFTIVGSTQLKHVTLLLTNSMFTPIIYTIGKNHENSFNIHTHFALRHTWYSWKLVVHSMKLRALYR